jgi:haloalkane dehalogenase
MIEALRTPEDRFADLPDFPYRPHHAETGPAGSGLRMAYLDEGPREAPHTYLCLHGNPTWSFLYRKFIPVLLADGGRVVAPDLFGFGRSDKPVDRAAYTFDLHRDALLRLIETLDLQRITLVCQDWGGLLGLTLPLAAPQRFARLLVMNTTFATGDAPLPQGFLDWRAWCRSQPDPAIGRLLKRSHPALSEAEQAAYEAPFPDARYKAGVLAFPEIVCDRPDAPGAAVSRAARDWWRNEWRGQSFMAIGMQDPVFGRDSMEALRAQIPGCPPPLELAEGGHFVQECGAVIPEAALAQWRG